MQGVFFRASTKDQALRLNITGHAINLPDGSVEVLACGSVAAVEKLEQWLHGGPPMATVTSGEATEVEMQEFDRFSVG